MLRATLLLIIAAFMVRARAHKRCEPEAPSQAAFHVGGILSNFGRAGSTWSQA
jgi:hypothetical protein